MKVAVVTGGNRGIGKEVCRQLAAEGFKVVLCSRDQAAGEAAAKDIEGDVTVKALEVTDPKQCQQTIDAIYSELGRIDVLINNAAIFPESGPGGTTTAIESSLDQLRQTFEVNAIAPFHLCQLVAPRMAKQGGGNIVNVTSGAGQLADMKGGYPGYRMSKSACNAVTRVFAFEFGEQGVNVNSCCPGWVKTDMGGPNALRTVEEGAKGIVWLAMQKETNGGFFRDGEVLDW